MVGRHPLSVSPWLKNHINYNWHCYPQYCILWCHKKAQQCWFQLSLWQLKPFHSSTPALPAWHKNNKSWHFAGMHLVYCRMKGAIKRQIECHSNSSFIHVFGDRGSGTLIVSQDEVCTQHLKLLGYENNRPEGEKWIHTIWTKERIFNNI